MDAYRVTDKQHARELALANAREMGGRDVALRIFQRNLRAARTEQARHNLTLIVMALLED